MTNPQTIPEISELVMLEQALYAGLRLWLLNYRSVGKGAKKKREASHSFMNALHQYRHTMGEEEFQKHYPMVSQELEGLLQKLR